MQFADIDDMDTVRTALVDVSAHVLVELLRANVWRECICVNFTSFSLKFDPAATRLTALGGQHLADILLGEVKDGG